jgi:hypothetical protein
MKGWNARNIRTPQPPVLKMVLLTTLVIILAYQYGWYPVKKKYKEYMYRMSHAVSITDVIEECNED